MRPQDPPCNIPQGIAILARIADQLGHQVGILDLNAHRLSLDAVREEIRGEDYRDADVMGITGLSSQYKFIKPLMQVIKKELPNALLVAGGGFLTSCPEDIMKLLPFDVGVIGEGERTFTELLDVVESKNFSRVKGMIYREDGELVRTPYRPLIENMDEIPWPHWDMLPLEVYFQNSAWLLGPASPPELQRCRRRMSIVTERGCPRACTFCQHLGQSAHDLRVIHKDRTIKGPNVRWNSAKYVVDMVKHLRFKYGVDFVSMLDENLMSNKKRAYEICDLWEQEDLVGLVHWGCLGDVASADYDLIQRMRDCGCRYVSYGGEVASDRLLREIKKYTTVKQTQNAIDATMKAGITPIVTYMCGYPQEKIGDYISTIEFWKRNQMLVRPFIITAYPGTELFYEHKDRILAQHGGDLERFLLSLGDATDLSANISPWDDATLLGLRELMIMQNANRIRRWRDGKSKDPVR